ncbi:carboxypeptidase B1-like [Malaya genurostris]|uniref:carboxypeptidase B1-like n=1 Tax=Malaya genurostris TaxID=325434 RepID=UPI0026F3E46F|nr:carboxypeptidase B1-like [Malaya genurostris]
MNHRSIKVILLLISVFSGMAPNKYDGYKLFEVNIKSGHEVELLVHLQSNRPGIDIWGLDRLGPKRLLVPPPAQNMTETYFKHYRLNYTVKAEDFGKNYAMSQHLQQPMEDQTFQNSFPTYDEINDYLMQMATENFEWIRIRIIGWSVEGRPIRAITLNHKKTDTIIVDAGIHAREWITVSTALYLIKKLIEDSDQYRYLHDYKWVIVPLVNPDGYIYSMTTDRYWRKNRRVVNNKCFGVDINRNFGFSWESGADLYSKECHPGFRGTAPFSEPEARALRSVLDSNDEAKLYISLHSYGGYFIFPWSHDSTTVQNVANLRQVGVGAARAIWHYSRNEYKVGSSAEILRYQATGTSIDYAYSIGIELPFAMEIAEYGYSDFQPPSSAIDQIVKESFVGIKEMVYAVKNLNTKKPSKPTLRSRGRG